jgi:hypothetical protein
VNKHHDTRSLILRIIDEYIKTTPMDNDTKHIIVHERNRVAKFLDLPKQDKDSF